MRSIPMFSASGKNYPGRKRDMFNSNEKPLLTFVLFAYNQEKFITEAVQGALSQTYSPLEIILSDDCSPDRTFEIMQEVASSYDGPNQVIVRRNEHNLGLIGHINRVMELAHGELIVVAAGDDVSLPERAGKLCEAFVMSGRKALSIYSSVIKIDEHGIQLGQISPYAPSQFNLRNMAERQVAVIGNSHAWHRTLFDVFGPLDSKVIQEDVVIPFRAALLGEVMAIRDPWVLRRYHTGNMWLHPKDSSYREKIAWHQERIEKRISNLIGIYQTKLSDLDVLVSSNKQFDCLASELQPLLQKSLRESEMEQRFFTSSGIERISLVFLAIGQKVPLRRLGRWIMQYGVAGLYYHLYRWFRLLKNQLSRSRYRKPTFFS
jgi:glycosyltransferase involved in cell wall biosynthesis